MYFLIVLITDYCWRSWTSRIAAPYKSRVDWLIELQPRLLATGRHINSLTFVWSDRERDEERHIKTRWERYRPQFCSSSPSAQSSLPSHASDRSIHKLLSVHFNWFHRQVHSTTHRVDIIIDQLTAVCWAIRALSGQQRITERESVLYRLLFVKTLQYG